MAFRKQAMRGDDSSTEQFQRVGHQPAQCVFIDGGLDMGAPDLRSS